MHIVIVGDESRFHTSASPSKYSVKRVAACVRITADNIARIIRPRGNRCPRVICFSFFFFVHVPRDVITTIIHGVMYSCEHGITVHQQLPGAGVFLSKRCDRVPRGTRCFARRACTVSDDVCIRLYGIRANTIPGDFRLYFFHFYNVRELIQNINFSQGTL